MAHIGTSTNNNSNSIRRHAAISIYRTTAWDFLTNERINYFLHLLYVPESHKYLLRLVQAK
jgi:hypothetical protein